MKIERKRGTMSIENEISLIICSNNLKRVLAKINDIQNINDFNLGYEGDEKIIDTYFDNISHSLQEKKFALRIRNKNDVDLVTLKGPPKYESHSVKRSESEYKWSKEAYGIITEQLKEAIEIDGKAIGKYFDENPIKTLQQIGFRDIHTRFNNRKIINITKKNDVKNNVIFEMDVDNVTFPLKSELKSFNVSVINIEIEKKDKKNDNDIALKIIPNYLREEFGMNTVREWKYGKLTLGKGIEKLYKEHKLDEDYVHSNSYLKCSALDKIEEFVNEGLI